MVKKYSELATQAGLCVLTTYNFIEAMLSEDALCITFRIVRPEGAIAEPGLVHIEEICPSMVTANSFLNGVKYALNIDVAGGGGFA